uniref:Uncharacterized protein n=1 Tax=Cannabis sativa TaxID=3483 RepID=A0A803NIJ2_CANSA
MSLRSSGGASTIVHLKGIKYLSAVLALHAIQGWGGPSRRKVNWFLDTKSNLKQSVLGYCLLLSARFQVVERPGTRSLGSFPRGGEKKKSKHRVNEGVEQEEELIHHKCQAKLKNDRRELSKYAREYSRARRKEEREYLEQGEASQKARLKNLPTAEDPSNILCIEIKEPDSFVRPSTCGRKGESRLGGTGRFAGMTIEWGEAQACPLQPRSPKALRPQSKREGITEVVIDLPEEQPIIGPSRLKSDQVKKIPEERLKEAICSPTVSWSGPFERKSTGSHTTAFLEFVMEESRRAELSPAAKNLAISNTILNEVDLEGMTPVVPVFNLGLNVDRA